MTASAPTAPLPHRPAAPLRAAGVLALAASVWVAAGCSGGDDDVTATDLGASGVGTCLQLDDSIGAEISELPAVECSEPHTHEIFAVIDSTADTYPGFDALEDEAQVACLEAFETYVGISAFDSNLFYSWMVPTLASWEDTDVGERGDREILCVAGAGDGEPLTQSVEATGW
ncbi:MAG: septum formation family protein [Ilumatobacter fluminis]|uniref:septum formation family protein n=1 Tax=Ilumatobacter fluminis TaxID=467091 RepID=UPI0032EC5427